MNKNEHVRSAVSHGIKMDMAANDPLIVRPAQLVVLSLLETLYSNKDDTEETKLMSLLKMFRALNDKFIDLLITRQQTES